MTCAWCGKELVGKDRARRVYCNRSCMAAARVKTPQTPEDGRYQAQNMFKAISCERCGATSQLHRHHKDRIATNNHPDNVEVLCSMCHSYEHRKPLAQSTCAVCGRIFVAKDHRSRAKICSAGCAAEWGRINARKRWGHE